MDLILRYLKIPFGVQIVHLGRKINELVYKNKSLNNAVRIENLDRIMQDEYPDLIRSARVLLLDDFSDTGSKAKYYKDRLRDLNLTQVRFVTLATQDDRVAISVDAVDCAGSSLGEFSNAIQQLAIFSTFGTGSESEYSKQMKAVSEAYFIKFKESLEDLQLKTTLVT